MYELINKTSLYQYDFDNMRSLHVLCVHDLLHVNVHIEWLVHVVIFSFISFNVYIASTLRFSFKSEPACHSHIYFIFIPIRFF